MRHLRRRRNPASSDPASEADVAQPTARGGDAQRPTDNLARFTSVLLYPSGNHHFVDVAAGYRQLLRPEVRTTRFVACTYESFIEALRAPVPSPKASAWLDYLERRYVVPR